MSENERKIEWELKKLRAMNEFSQALYEQAQERKQPPVEEKRKNALKSLKLPDHKDVRIFIAGMFFVSSLTLSVMVFTTSDMPLRTALVALTSILMAAYLWYTRDNEQSDQTDDPEQSA